MYFWCWGELSLLELMGKETESLRCDLMQPVRSFVAPDQTGGDVTETLQSVAICSVLRRDKKLPACSRWYSRRRWARWGAAAGLWLPPSARTHTDAPTHTAPDPTRSPAHTLRQLHLDSRTAAERRNQYETLRFLSSSFSCMMTNCYAQRCSWPCSSFSCHIISLNKRKGTPDFIMSACWTAGGVIMFTFFHHQHGDICFLAPSTDDCWRRGNVTFLSLSIIIQPSKYTRSLSLNRKTTQPWEHLTHGANV